MSLPIRPIDAQCSVAPQAEPTDMAAVAAAGFRSVINNRPDFEHGPDQPTHQHVEAAAHAAGLVYRFLPVSGGYQSPEEIAACAALLAEVPTPVLMFCRSGARSTQLYLQARALS
jgi:uncharacterized protein (TIGR01244 family)